MVTSQNLLTLDQTDLDFDIDQNDDFNLDVPKDLKQTIQSNSSDSEPI
jgi:hypothetical protein